FAHGRFDELAVSFDLAEEHGALNHRDAKVRQLVLARVGLQTAARFLLDKESGNLRLHDLEDQAEVLADELVVLRDLVANRSERTSARHLEALLQAEMCEKPALEIVP